MAKERVYKPMSGARLKSKAKYISENCQQPRFKFILKNAKKEWTENGKTIRVDYIMDDGYRNIEVLNCKDLKKATERYIRNNGAKMAELDRESSRRYRGRQKYKLAVQNVQNGLSPVIFRNYVRWTPGVKSGVVKMVEYGYFPIVRDKKMEWERSIPAMS